MKKKAKTKTDSAALSPGLAKAVHGAFKIRDAIEAPVPPVEPFLARWEAAAREAAWSENELLIAARNGTKITPESLKKIRDALRDAKPEPPAGAP